MKLITFLSALAATSLFMVGCDNRNDTIGDDLERAGERANDGLREAGNELESAADRLERESRSAAERTGERLEDAGDRIQREVQ